MRTSITEIQVKTDPVMNSIPFGNFLLSQSMPTGKKNDIDNPVKHKNNGWKESPNKENVRDRISEVSIALNEEIELETKTNDIRPRNRNAKNKLK